jgi:RNA polymerase sigma-70 factor (ECF subfamily)
MWPDARDTQQLLEAARAGDAGATDALWERHRAAVHKLVAMRLDRGVQARVDVSDVVQDTLVEANRRIGSYLEKNGELPFHLWLRQIANDRMIDAHRRHRQAGRRSVDQERHLGAVEFSDQSALDLAGQLRDHRELTPAAALLRGELAEQFRAALAKMEDADREIIEMRHVECLTNQECAQSLGLSEPAAGMRYLRALRRMRALLDEGASQAGDV